MRLVNAVMIAFFKRYRDVIYYHCSIFTTVYYINYSKNKKFYFYVYFNSLYVVDFHI